jgi:WD40 repeat protein
MIFADPSVLTGNLVGHTDAVWGLSIHNQRMQLLSCGADGLVCLWSPQNKVPLLSTFSSPEGTCQYFVSEFKFNRVINLQRGSQLQ